MIYFLIFLIGWYALQAWTNYYWIKDSQKFHTSQAIETTYLIVGILSQCCWNILQVDLAGILALGFVALTFRWIFFDLFLNWFRGLPWCYTGRLSGDKYKNSTLDRLGNWQFPIKFILLFISSYYIILFW